MTVSTFTIAAATVLLWATTAEAAARVSNAECNARFSRIDRNKDGSIGSQEGAATYFDQITRAGSSSDRDDGFIMGRKFFMIECMLGSFD
jgi:hypothetical protein